MKMYVNFTDRNHCQRQGTGWLESIDYYRVAENAPWKEVIQPQVPLRLPCYDFTPVAHQTLGVCLPKVGLTTSGPINSHGVTGGVYKARERIHRGVLIHDY